MLGSPGYSSWVARIAVTAVDFWFYGDKFTGYWHILGVHGGGRFSLEVASS